MDTVARHRMKIINFLNILSNLFIILDGIV